MIYTDLSWKSDPQPPRYFTIAPKFLLIAIVTQLNNYTHATSNTNNLKNEKLNVAAYVFPRSRGGDCDTINMILYDSIRYFGANSSYLSGYSNLVAQGEEVASTTLRVRG